MYAMPRVPKRTEPKALTEPALSQAPTLRGWQLATGHRLASSPRAAIAASATTPCGPEADTLRGSVLADHAADNRAAEDWDLLFRAALDFLEQVAVERPLPTGGGRRLLAPAGTALRECLEALDQLRRSMPGNLPPA